MYHTALNRAQRPQPLKFVFVAALHVLGNMAETEPAVCAICLSAMEEEVSTLCCNHGFHTYCMNTYMEAHNLTIDDVKCPVCKQCAGDFPEGASPRDVATAAAVAAAAASAAEATAVPPGDDADATQPATDDVGTEEASTADGSGPSCFMTRPCFDAPSVFCTTCGSQAVASKCRLLSKRKGNWRCNNCNTKVVQLFRGFGSWPNMEFKGLAEEEQQAFMRSVHNDADGAKTCAKAKEFLSAHEKHETFYEFGGEFLPLSVWATRGFDATAIEAKTTPEDRSVHAVLGDCYRVKIMKGGQRGSEGSSRTENMSASKKPKIMELLQALGVNVAAAGAVPAATPAAAVTAPEPTPVATPAPPTPESEEGSDGSNESGSDSDDSDDSDSDESMSESEEKQKKKKGSKKKAKAKKSSKKTKKGGKSKKSKSSKSKKQKAKVKAAAKAEKAKAKLEQEKAKAAEEKRVEKEKAVADKERAAKGKATMTLATQMVSKLTGPMNSLSCAMAKPECSHLPELVSQSARTQLQSLSSMHRLAQNALTDSSVELPIAGMKELTKMLSEAKKTEVLINQMLSTMTRLVG